MIVIDAGHGGQDSGAVFQGRQEKNDTLRLALLVGKILSEQGVDVQYTRISDVYQTPFEKAQMANDTEADYFLSIHRNAMPTPGSASGVESLVYENTGVPAVMAENINAALEQTGFRNLGVIERPGLVVLRKTEMPAVLVEVGFIDHETDNLFFDSHLEAIARAIADGVMATIKEEEMEAEYFQIQTGAFREWSYADRMLKELQKNGFPAFLVFRDGLYKVRVGMFLNIDNAAWMEKKLRSMGYSTMLVTERGSEIYAG